MPLPSHLIRVFDDIPFNRTLGLQIDQIELDFITLRFKMQKELIGNFLQNILHGGVISSVLDMAGGVAAMSYFLQKETQYDLNELALKLGKMSTVNLQINFLRPGKGDEFTAKAHVLRSGNKITVTQMELLNEASLLIAMGTGTYLM